MVSSESFLLLLIESDFLRLRNRFGNKSVKIFLILAVFSLNLENILTYLMLSKITRIYSRVMEILRILVALSIFSAVIYPQSYSSKAWNAREILLISEANKFYERTRKTSCLNRYELLLKAIKLCIKLEYFFMFIIFSI